MCTSPHALSPKHSWTSRATDFRCALSPSLSFCFFITFDLIKIAFTLLKLVSSAWYSSVSFVGLFSLHLCGRSGCSLLFLRITSLLSFINLRSALCSMPNLEPGIVLVFKLLPVYLLTFDWLRAVRSGIESQWGRDIPPVQTGPGANTASCKMGNGSFPGVKFSRGVLLTTHPLLVPRSWKSRAIPLPTL
jgi:hypothetical protein